jgi:hypothetical protein
VAGANGGLSGSPLPSSKLSFGPKPDPILLFEEVKCF